MLERRVSPNRATPRIGGGVNSLGARGSMSPVCLKRSVTVLCTRKTIAPKTQWKKLFSYGGSLGTVTVPTTFRPDLCLDSFRATKPPWLVHMNRHITDANFSRVSDAELLVPGRQFSVDIFCKLPRVTVRPATGLEFLLSLVHKECLWYLNKAVRR